MVLAPLQFSGRSLTPDVLGGIQQGQQVSQGRNILEQQRLGIKGTQQEQALKQQQAEQAAALQQQAQDLFARSQAGEKGVATGAELGQILLKDKKLGNTLRDVIGLNTEAKKLQAARFGRALEQAVGDIPAQNRIIQQNIADIEARGGDASHSKELLTLPESRRLKAARLFQLNALNRDELAALTTGTIEQQRKPVDPLLVENKLTSAGFVKGTPQFQNALKQILGVDQPADLSPLQKKVAAEGLDPNTPAGQARARELNQRAATDPSLKPSDQQILAKASEGQLAAAGFANRVQAANTILTTLESKKGFDPTSIQASILRSVPGGNIVLSEEQQQFQQAKEDFITAVLRKESGAAIGVEEFEKEDRKFFPQIGDKPGTLTQKAEGRERAFQNLSKQSKGVFRVQFDNPQIFDDGQQATTPPSGRQGGTLMTDAQGNRAFVFPDGSFEEVR
jgi:hypothetical protein